MICLYFKSPLFWHYFWKFGLPHLVLSSFFSAEWFGTEFREFASIFVPRNGIPSCFFFRWSVRKGIQRDIFYFLLNGTEFRVLFSSAEGFGTEFRDFLLRGTTGIPLEITSCSVDSVFRGIIFLSEIPNPRGGELPLGGVPAAVYCDYNWMQVQLQMRRPTRSFLSVAVWPSSLWYVRAPALWWYPSHASLL